MKLSIAFITGRREPRLEWLIESLHRQADPSDEIELIVVDVMGRDPHEIGYTPVPCVANLIATKPKPTVWQGEHRVTSCDWWALSNARNTAFVRATTDYIAFLDDRCYLGPEWLETVRAGYRTRDSVLAGSYEKFEQGDHDLPRTTVDHRREHMPGGMRNCGGGWLFGCTFSLPLEWALQVNGFEEGCDGLGMEDVIFGLHLHNAGRRVDFVPSMFVQQDRMIAGNGPVYMKVDKGTSPSDKSHAALDRFGTRSRTELTPDLREIRELVTAQPDYFETHTPNPDRLALRDWYDGELICQMR